MLIIHIHSYMCKYVLFFFSKNNTHTRLIKKHQNTQNTYTRIIRLDHSASSSMKCLHTPHFDFILLFELAVGDVAPAGLGNKVGLFLCRVVASSPFAAACFILGLTKEVNGELNKLFWLELFWSHCGPLLRQHDLFLLEQVLEALSHHFPALSKSRRENAAQVIGIGTV